MGREEWMRRVVERYEGPLVRYAFRFTGDLERARDTVQDVLLRLWCEEDAGRPVDNLGGWLFMVCRNRALDIQRKENRMQPLNEQYQPVATMAEPSPDTALENKEHTQEILRWLAKLPVNQQEVIRLKFQEGLTYQEISLVTRLSVTNVGFLIHAAIKSLRHKLRLPEKRPLTA